MNSEAKRQEKLFKRFKPLLDDKLKVKQRLRSLESFLECSTEADEQKYFILHDNTIYHVVYESIQVKIAKLREKPNAANSKEGSLFELLDLFWLIAKYCSAKINQGWQHSNTVNLLSALLASVNHYKVRRHGLKILLKILNSQVEHDKDFLQLYATAFEVQGFEWSDMFTDFLQAMEKQDQDQLPVKEFNWESLQPRKDWVVVNRGASSVAIIPVDPTESAEEMDILQDIIEDIMSLAAAVAAESTFSYYTRNEIQSILQSDTASKLCTAWELFRDHYMTLFFPRLCLALGHPMSPTIEYNYNKTCPKPILNMLLDFITQFSAVEKLSEQSQLHELCAALLNQLLYHQPKNFELIHEVLRQSFLLKMGEKPLSIVVKIVKSTAIDYTLGPMLNRMIKRYLHYLKAPLAKTAAESDIEQYRDLGLFCRYLGYCQANSLEEDTWMAIMNVLLDVKLSIMTPNEASLAYCSSKNGSLTISYLTETMLMLWIRKSGVSLVMWEKLERLLAQYSEVAAIYKHWSVILIDLTYKVASDYYGIDSTLLKQEYGIRKKNQKQKVREQGSQSALNTEKVAKATPKLEHVSNTPNPIQRSTISLEFTKSEEGLFIPEATGTEIMKGKTEDFMNVKSLQCNQKALYSSWKNLICCIGKIHCIKDPMIHYDAVSTIIQVWDILERLRCALPEDSKKEPSSQDMIGIIFRAAQMPLNYAKSISIASSALFRIVCKKQSADFSPKWKMLFFAIIKRNLKTRDENVMFSIIQSATKLFTTRLPGATLLIPSIIESIGHLLTLPDCPDVVFRSMLSILGSLICFEKQYRDLNFVNSLSDDDYESLAYDPIGPLDEPIGANVFKNLIFEIKNLLQVILQTALKAKRYEHSEVCLWNFCLIYMEYNHVTFLRNDVFSILLEHLSTRNKKIVKAVVEGLLIISENAKPLNIADDLIVVVIDRIAFSISEQLSFNADPKSFIVEIKNLSFIVSQLMNCLLAWLMIAPNYVFSNPNISLRVSEAIEETIHVAGLLEPKDDHSAEYLDIVKHLQFLKESAESTMTHLTHYIDGRPPIQELTNPNDQIFEESSADAFLASSHQYFSQGKTIIGFIDHQETNFVELLVRDCVGKYSWTFSKVYHSLNERKNAHRCPLHHNKELKSNTSCMSFQRGKSVESALLPSKPIDRFDLILGKLAALNTDCFYNSITDDSTDHTSEMVQKINKHMEYEQGIAIQTKVELDSNHDIFKTEKPETPMHERAYLDVRQFLSHLGHLSFDHLKEQKWYLLEKSQGLLRDLRGIDRMYSREIAKIAVIYVGPGQETEAAILKNTSGSKQFREFVNSLGTIIDMKNHAGYVGGLDSSLVSDDQILYFSNSTKEIVFHDVTRMTNDPNDQKQLKKKRHIGNDHVHIVWNEHSREYKWDTVGGDFGNAQILITPLKDDIYAVETYRDENVDTFGPLQPRSLVSKQYLGSLVRSTAFNAYKSAHAAGMGDTPDYHPFTLRKQTIELISERYGLKVGKFEGLMKKIFSDPMETHIINAQAP